MPEVNDLVWSATVSIPYDHDKVAEAIRTRGIAEGKLRAKARQNVSSRN